MTVAAGNLLVNPSFEEPPQAYVDLPGGSSHLPGWTTILSGAEVFTSTDIGLGFPWPTTIAHGNQAVDLPPALRSGGGGIEQSFGTIPGKTYEVSFALGTVLAHDRDGTGTVEVEVDGQVHSYNLATLNSDWEWFNHSFMFLADNSMATLTFRSFDNPALHIASVDNVSVLSVPDKITTGTTLAATMGLLLICTRARCKEEMLVAS